MTDISLAFSAASSGLKTFKAIEWDSYELGVLVSFFYIAGFRKLQATTEMTPRLWTLDSGAFSAWSSGKIIDMDALMEECRNPMWHECVALDVVHDPQKSLENALKMQAAGCKSYPVFHVGEPMEFLAEEVPFLRVGPAEDADDVPVSFRRHGDVEQRASPMGSMGRMGRRQREGARKGERQPRPSCPDTLLRRDAKRAEVAVAKGDGGATWSLSTWGSRLRGR